MDYTVKLISIDTFFSYKHIDSLLQEYSDESKGVLVPVVKTDIVLYKTLEDLGILDLIVMYNDETIVGFISLMTTVMPHYSEKASTVESIFVLKEHRKFGTGKVLISKAESIAKDKDAKAMFMSAPKDGVLSKVIGTYGFTETNTVYTKKIV